MPAFLTVDHLSVSAADGTSLFSDLGFSLNRENIGLVGRNGCGKSTLLSLLAGEDAGGASCSGAISRHGRFALLRQIGSDAGSVADALGVAGPLALLRRMEAGDGSAEDAARADWGLEARLAEAFLQMGLAAIGLNAPVRALSGGQRMRLGIAALLLGRNDVLLLDEPTNDMDEEGRGLIADMLRGWRGGAIVASHDRALLEQMDRIIHLSPVGCTVFGGGWGGFTAARDAMRERAEAELERAVLHARQVTQSAREQAERQARRDKAGWAKRARGDAPKILLDAQADRAQRTAGRGRDQSAHFIEEARHRMEEARQRVEVVTPLHIDLPPSRLPAGRVVLRMEDVVCARPGKDGHPARPLFGPLSLTISGPQRLAINGPNGSGKTSLLRIIMGLEEPAFGMVFRAEGALVMLDQHCSLINPALSLLENMQARHPGMISGQAHEVLARFAFRNRDALRPAATLSGGERLRAALALVTGGPVPPQLLLLDEPTNHLDMDSAHMLKEALRSWDGALILISHDAAFRDAVGIDREIYLPAG